MKDIAAAYKKEFMDTLWEMTGQFLDTGDTDQALRVGLKSLLTTLKGEAGAIWILNQENDTLYPGYWYGPVDLSGIVVQKGTGIEGMAAWSGRPLLITNVFEAADYAGSIYDALGLLVKTMMLIPLKVSDEAVGCIEIVNRKDGGLFQEEEKELAERLAALASMTFKGLPASRKEDKRAIVSLRNVTKDYQNPGETARILKGISLDVYEGEFLVVMGESGSGKTTLLNIIGGMDQLTGGKIMVNGKDYSDPAERDLTMLRRHYIGFVFQSYNLIPNLSVLDNVRFTAELCNNPMRPAEALHLVGLGGKERLYPAQLSGGQQQRVAIARALVKNPALILADEPTGALDYETSIEVLTAIENVVRTHSTTVIMVTHNPEIGKIADRVVKLKDGKISGIVSNDHPLKARQLEW